MPSHRNNIYLLLSVACMAGYIWLYFAYAATPDTSGPFAEVCIIKHATNIPCPSCGATRSALALLHGDFLDSLYWNPIGILLLIILLATPAWVLYDLCAKKITLQKFYFNTESFLRQKSVAIPAIILLVGNWFWNIYKGL